MLTENLYRQVTWDMPYKEYRKMCLTSDDRVERIKAVADGKITKDETHINNAKRVLVLSKMSLVINQTAPEMYSRRVTGHLILK